MARDVKHSRRAQNSLPAPKQCQLIEGIYFWMKTVSAAETTNLCENNPIVTAAECSKDIVQHGASEAVSVCSKK